MQGHADQGRMSGCSDQPDARFPRRAERTPFSKKTVLHLQPARAGASELRVQICDYSPVGLGFVSETALERGQQFTVRIAPPHRAAANMLYCVAYCARKEDGAYKVGAEFVCMPSDAASSDLPPDTKILRDRIRRAMLS